jgi:hypothetical protein
MVWEPLCLTLQAHIERISQLVLGRSLQGHWKLLRSKGFKPVRVHTDPLSAFQIIATQFENVTSDIRGVGNYLPKADSKVRRVK